MERTIVLFFVLYFFHLRKYIYYRTPIVPYKLDWSLK